MDKKKVILAVTKSNFGGAQRYVFDIANNLPKDKFDVLVLCGGSGLLVEKLNKINIRTISLSYMQRDISFGSEIRALFDLIKIFQKEKPNIVHLNSPKMGGLGALAVRIVSLISKLKAENLKLKSIYTVHGWTFNEERPLWQNILIRIFSWLTVIFSHHIITISKKDTDQARLFPFSAGKINYIPLGISAINFLSKEDSRKEIMVKLPWINNNDQYWLVSIAELHPNKNLLPTIEAVAEFNKQSAKKILYLIFGEGEQRKKLEQNIKFLKSENEIFLLGFQQNAPELLKAFDAFILASKKEGLPYVILEAGLAELLVIASNVGGIPDIIKNKESGILLEKPDKLSVQKALREIDNPANNKISSNLNTTIKQKLTIDKMIDSIIKLYI
jgi:glycosyltransferase involved in cell wall biosynthesis